MDDSLLILALPPLTKEQREEFKRRAAALKTWNSAVATVHLSSFTALLVLSIVFYDSAKQVRLWTDFGGVAVQPRGSYRLFYTLLPFPFITGIFHVAIAAFDADNYSRSVLLRGTNRLRWLEYAITNGLISWSLAVLAGAGSLLFPVVAVLCNFVMQFFGYLHEHFNYTAVNYKKGERKTRVYRSLWFIGIGFVPWIANWLVVLVYFFERTGAAPVNDWLAVIGSLVWSLAFVAPLLWRFYQPDSIAVNYYTELAYILLSLSAKLWLDWVVTIGSF